MTGPGFESILANTLGHERGWSNHPGDPGGETWRGISRRRWPEWPGWSLIDRHKRNREFPAPLWEDPDLTRLVVEFYRKNFWLDLKADQLPGEVAERLFDVAVNCGAAAARWQLQAVVRLAGQPLRLDGVLGAATLAAVRAVPPARLLELWRPLQTGYYIALVVKVDPGLAEFVNGWAARAAAE